MVNPSGASADALPLPKGGGSVRGLGDGFKPDLNRGTGSYAIRIEVPKSHRGLAPQLVLGYNTASGDGPFGYGWNLPLARIQIDTDSGIANYLEPRYLLDAEELVEVDDALYRPRVENTFHRIRRVGAHWELTDKSGMVTRFGGTAASRLRGDVLGSERTFAWLPDLVRDTSGNELRYFYREDGGQLYLERIEFAHFQVRLEYELRHDPSVNRRPGFPISTRLRCRSIEVVCPGEAQELIRRYECRYDSNVNEPSLLSRVTMQGFKRQPDGRVVVTEAPPVTLEYTHFAPETRQLMVIGDELTEPPGPLGQAGRELVDLDGDGLPDIVQLGAGRARIWRNVSGGQLALPRTLSMFPHPMQLGASAMFIDADGTGTADLFMLSLESATRFYPNSGKGIFERPRFLGGRLPLNFDASDADAALADVNGDGRVDLVKTSERGLITWHNLGGEDGYALPTAIPRLPDRDDSPDVRLSSHGVFFADMTGDGLPDVVHVKSGLVEYWPALGDGRYAQRTVMEGAPVLPRNYEPARLFFADVDGAGTSDLIYVGPDRVVFWRNLGGVRFAPPVEVVGTPQSSPESIRVVDFLGSAMVGILWSGVGTMRGSAYRFLSLCRDKPFLLSRVREGTGLETTISYDTSSLHASRDVADGHPWTTFLPVPIPVVRSIALSDPATDFVDASEISYHDGHWDSRARRFSGFGRVTVRRFDASGTSAVHEEHRYLVGSPDEPSVDGGDGVALDDLDRARTGQCYRTTLFSGDLATRPLRTEETIWRFRLAVRTPSGVAILHPQVAETEVLNFEGTEHPRAVTTRYEYDAHGNVLLEARRGHAPSGDDSGAPVSPVEVRSEIEYAINPETYVVDRVARIVKRAASGDVLAEIRHYYDGADFEGLPLGSVTSGLLKRQEEIVLTHDLAASIYGADAPDWSALGYHTVATIDGRPAWAVNQTRFAYTPRGLISRRRDALGEEIEYGYDDDGLLVKQLTNALGHVRGASYDRAWQLIESHTMPNGAATSYRYDGLGRVTALIRPGDSEAFPTVSYVHDHAHLPNSVRTERRRTPGQEDASLAVAFFDGQGHEIQTRTVVDDVRVRVSGIVRLDQRGQPVFRGRPSFRTGLAYESADVLDDTQGFHYEYDGSGRLVRATNPLNKVFEVSYTPWQAVLSDCNDTDSSHPDANTPRIQHFDVFGRLSALTLVNRDMSRATALYTYDPLGRLVSTADLTGRPALRALHYDQRGARLVIDHAAAGTRTAAYDARGRLVKYWDARRRFVERTFDAAGRPLTESVDGNVVERYHYDARPEDVGRLTSVDDAGGTVSFRYDGRGRVRGKTREIGAETYEIGYEYDSSDCQREIRYPSGESATFERWGDGRVRRVPGFVNEIDYDERGLLARVTHGNGVFESFDYDAAGYLESLEFERGGESYFDASLSHDGVGRLVRFEDSASAETHLETYEHDAFGRLVQHFRQRGAETNDATYDYDADGNLLRADEMGASAYTYDFTRPGALASRTLQGGATETIEFDDAGHLTAMLNWEVEFDARGRLVRMTKNDGTLLEMTYDYRGARIRKRVTGPDGVHETRYVDELYEDSAGIGTGSVFAAGRLVGFFRGGGRRHTHVDHRGSVVLVTHPNGSVDGRRWFGPYGSISEESGAEPPRGFTGAVVDRETGLCYLNQRYYSPALGRFLSPDPRFLAQPERELDLPEAHNLFAYAKGDPIDYVDPTGEGFWSTFGKVLAGIVVVVAVIAAVAVVVWLIATAGAALLLGALVGAVIGGIVDGWQGAALGAMMGATIGINFMIFPPAGIVTFLGVFPGIRKSDWYKSLAGWGSWFMPASWPGHILGLGVFLANGIAHVFGSDSRIESVKFDWKHGQILTAGGEYGGTPFPWLGLSGPSHSLGGFAFWSNATWEEGGKTWGGIENTVNSGRGYAHETGHMLGNALFGFWQGIINGIENMTTENHDDRFFEKIAQSNVEPGDRNPDDQVIPFWN